MKADPPSSPHAKVSPFPIYVINSEEYVMWRITHPRTTGITFIYAREIG